jgi:RHS repeat-associated protein
VYRYNGLGYRIQWQYDENINFTLSSSERFYFLYDDRWRIVATFRDSDASAKESFVYHAAGVAGRGGSSYIDSVILRDKDANTGWTSAADGTLEDRVFYAQNWRADVVAITKSDGQPTEFIRYTSYGTAQAFAAADVNRDGTVNSTDATDWSNLYSESPSGAAIPVDFDFDGSSFNPDDNDAFTAAYNEASGWTNGGLGAGGGKLSRIGNRKGYAGYEYDPAIVSYHVRHRVYVPEIGRWTKRDPLGYVDGMSVYQYVSSCAILLSDPSGLISFMCALRVAALLVEIGVGLTEVLACPGTFGATCIAAACALGAALASIPGILQDCFGVNVPPWVVDVADVAQLLLIICTGGTHIVREWPNTVKRIKELWKRIKEWFAGGSFGTSPNLMPIVGGDTEDEDAIPSGRRIAVL